MKNLKTADYDTETTQSYGSNWTPKNTDGNTEIPMWACSPWEAIPNVLVIAAEHTNTTWAQKYAQVLSDVERSYARRFATRQLCQRWSASRILLRTVLADGLNTHPEHLEFERSAAGKPELGGVHKNMMSFSLAHTERWTVIATSFHNSLGVDAEKRVTAEVAAELTGMFTPIEQRQVANLSANKLQTVITQLWTRKEAYLKALGTGLLRDPGLDTIGVELQPRIPSNAPVGTTIADLPVLPGTDIHGALCAMSRE